MTVPRAMFRAAHFRDRRPPEDTGLVPAGGFVGELVAPTLEAALRLSVQRYGRVSFSHREEARRLVEDGLPPGGAVLDMEDGGELELSPIEVHG